jgi:hypothetical protein
MFVLKIAGCAAAAAIAAFISVGSTRAAMSPVVPHAVPNVHHVDCAVGFHLGPAGACIVGTDDAARPHERRATDEDRPVDEGCKTKSVQRTDSEGNTETKTKSNCP